MSVIGFGAAEIDKNVIPIEKSFQVNARKKCEQNDSCSLFTCAFGRFQSVF